MLGIERVEKVKRIAQLTRQFRQAIERQHKHDADRLASVVRALKSPRGPASEAVDSFGEIIRGLVREELRE